MRSAIAFLALLALVACSSTKTKPKVKDSDAPAKLAVFAATLKVDRVWAANVGGTKVPLRLGLGLTVDGDRVYAAGSRGEIAAFMLATGHPLWHTRTKAPLAGAVGVGGGLIVVGSSDGDVIALNAADGVMRWRALVNGEVLSAPAVAPHAVIVRTVDGKLRGLDLKDGHELWDHEQTVPRLSLRGTGRPVTFGDLAICGFDNGKVVAVNSTDGSSVWEAIVSPPHGKTELERLVDIDSPVTVGGEDVYVAGFQGHVAMLALDTGQVWWSHDASSDHGLDMDGENLYVAGADGEIVALHRQTGAEVWRQKLLANRSISGPAVSDRAIAVGDFQGYVHWFDKASGAPAARARVGKMRITNPPVAVGNLLLVINDRGQITAFRITPIHR